MINIHTEQTLELSVEVKKGNSTEPLDLQGAEWALMLLDCNGKNIEVLDATLEADGSVKTVFLADTLSSGVYGIKLLWRAETGNRAYYVEKRGVWSVDDDEPNPSTASTVRIKVSQYADTYGYDGLSAYELAVLKGYTTLPEDQWVIVGEKGDSAYQVAVKNGFVGTESQWLASLKGEAGAAGPAGPAGPAGATGNSGYSGDISELEVVNNLTQGGATAALSAEQGKVLGNTVYGTVESDPVPIQTIETTNNEFRYDATNLVGYLLNAHSTTNIDIFNVTSLQGRAITFQSYRYSNTYVNYALVTDYTKLPMPAGTSAYNANIAQYKADWNNILVQECHSGTAPTELTLPTGYTALYFVIQYLKTEGSGKVSIKNKVVSTPGITDKIDKLASKIEEEAKKETSNESSIMYRKYIEENFPYYLASDYTSADSFDYGSHLEKRIRDVQKTGSNSSFVFVTDTHWFPTNGTDGDEGNARKSNILMDYVRNRTGARKVLFGGDAFNMATDKYKAAAMLSGFSDEFFSAFGSDGIFCIGNHDCNQARHAQTLSDESWIPDTEVYKRTVGQMKQKNIVYDTDLENTVNSLITAGTITMTDTDKEQFMAWNKMHYYVDDADSKTRFVVLESNDEGYSTTKVIGVTGFNATVILQQKFLCDSMQSLPEGYNMVICSHTMFHSNGTGDSLQYGLGLSWLATMRYVSAFKAKQSRALYISDTLGDLITAVTTSWNKKNYDFSSRKDIGKILVLYGHSHCDDYYVCRASDPEGVNSRTRSDGYGCAPYSDTLTMGDEAILVVNTTCDSFRLAETPTAKRPHALWPTMELNTVTEHSFSVFSFVDDGVVMTRFGAGTSKKFRC